MANQSTQMGSDEDRPVEVVMITLPDPLKGKYKGCIGGFYFDRGVSISRMITPSDKVALKQFLQAWPGANVTLDIPPTLPITPRQVNRAGRYMTAPRMVKEKQDDVLLEINRRNAASKRREVRSEIVVDVADASTLVEEPRAENPLEGTPSNPAILTPKGPKSSKS